MSGLRVKIDLRTGLEYLDPKAAAIALATGTASLTGRPDRCVYFSHKRPVAALTVISNIIQSD